MSETEIINLWKSGLSKNTLAKIYKRRHNQIIKILRLEVRNRHMGKFISEYDALKYIEVTIYKYIRESNTKF